MNDSDSSPTRPVTPRRPQLLAPTRPTPATPVVDPPPLPMPPDPAALKPPPAKNRGCVPLAGWVLGLVMGGALAIGLIAGMVWSSPLILPGGTMLAQSFTWQSTHEAASSLESIWQGKQGTVIIDDQAITRPLTDWGFELDENASAVRAYRSSRNPTTWLQRHTVAPVWSLDVAKLEQTLTEIAAETDRSTTTPNIQFTEGQLIVMPGDAGLQLNIAAAMGALAQQSSAFIAGETVALPVDTQPSAKLDAVDIAQTAEALLNRSFSIRLYDPIRDETISLDMPPSDWGTLLHYAIDNSGRLIWQVDPAAVETYLNDQASQWGSDRYLNKTNILNALESGIRTNHYAAKARLFHHPQTHIVQSGETLSQIGITYGIPYPWIQAANPSIGTLQVGQEITIPSPDDLIPLPPVANKRIIVSLSAQRVDVIENGETKWTWPTSTGIAGSPTAPGVFQIQTHRENAYASVWDLWMPKFMGIYRPVPTADFMNGFHGFPTRDGHTLLWTNSLGSPATYGCILLSNENAQSLFDWAEDGVIVEVQP